MNENANIVPVYRKYALTINQAAQYFNIGEKKLRKIAEEQIDTGLIIQNGSKILIKREAFEKFLNNVTAV